MLAFFLANHPQAEKAVQIFFNKSSFLLNFVIHCNSVSPGTNTDVASRYRILSTPRY
jgi:hypothetical protein